jgi:hypothetical protein
LVSVTDVVEVDDFVEMHVACGVVARVKGVECSRDATQTEAKGVGMLRGQQVSVSPIRSEVSHRETLRSEKRRSDESDERRKSVEWPTFRVRGK